MNEEGQAPQGDAATVEVHGTEDTNQAPQSEAANSVSLEQYQALEGKIAKMLDENKSYRDERRETRAKQQALLEEQGQFKALADERAATIDELSAKVAELEGLRGQADAWGRHQEAETARIEQRAEALSPEDREIVSKISDLADRGRMVDRLLGTNAKPVAEIPRAGSPSNSSSGADFATLHGAEKQQAIRDNPAEWAAHIRGKQSGAGRSTMERFFGPKR